MEKEALGEWDIVCSNRIANKCANSLLYTYRSHHVNNRSNCRDCHLRSLFCDSHRSSYEKQNLPTPAFRANHHCGRNGHTKVLAPTPERLSIWHQVHRLRLLLKVAIDGQNEIKNKVIDRLSDRQALDSHLAMIHEEKAKWQIERCGDKHGDHRGQGNPHAGEPSFE